MKNVSENLLKKIKALLDKAESSDSQQETETFISKANELLLKYNLEMSSIENISNKEEIESTDGTSLQEIKEHGTYDEGLITTLAKYNFLDLIWRTRGKEKQFILVGEKQNIEITLYLFSFLKTQLPIIGNKKYSDEVLRLRDLYKETGSIHSIVVNFNYKFPELGDIELSDLMPSSYKEELKNQNQIWYLKNLKFADLPNRSTYLRSFLLGCSNGLRTRLEEERNNFIKNEKIDSNSTALTIQSLIFLKDKENKIFINKTFKNLKTFSKKFESPSDKNAFNNGVQTGKSIPLSTGLTNSQNIIQKQLN